MQWRSTRTCWRSAPSGDTDAAAQRIAFSLLSAGASGRASPPRIAPQTPSETTESPPKTIPELLRLIDAGAHRGCATEADRLLPRLGRSSLEFVQACLLASLGYQQLGDVEGADARILQAEHEYIQTGDDQDELVRALINAQKVWLLSEQAWKLARADTFGIGAIPILHRAGFTSEERAMYHFLARNAGERLMSASGAFLSARPRKLLTHEQESEARRALDDYLPKARAGDEDNVHHAVRAFNLRSLLPDERHPLDDLLEQRSDLRAAQGEHLLHFAQARQALSDQRWRDARDFGEMAMVGYREQRFPQGIALSATVQAEGILNHHPNDPDARDLLLLALLLHWHPHHPLWKISLRRLERWAALNDEGDGDLKAYLREEFDERVRLRAGIFAACKDVDIPMAYQFSAEVELALKAQAKGRHDN